VEINLLGTIENLFEIRLYIFHNNKKVIALEVWFMDNIFEL